MEKFDLVVIGGGPAGYVGAIRAAQLGMKVACIEKRGTLGGTCLNVGCIPSKALLESSEKLAETKHEIQKHGITCDNIAFDLDTMMQRKNNIVADLNKGIESLFKKNKITYFQGLATLKSKNEVLIKSEKDITIAAEKILIATGSSVMDIPNVIIDEEKIISSTGALKLNKIPKTMVVIGAGAIGLEMGSVWQRLGTEVTIVEYLDVITATMDIDVSKQLHKSLEKQGLKFMLSTKLISAKINGKNVDIELESKNGDDKQKISADCLLIAVGRKPNTEGLGLENVGIECDDRGRVKIDNNFATNVKNIFAVGDVVIGPMLAHKAEEEAIAAVEIMHGQSGHVNYNAIPSVIYTWPEAASVGYTEMEVKNQNIEVNIGKFPFLANSRARTSGYTDGFVKIIARKDNDEVLGVHIVGPHAGTLIAEAVLAMEYKASSEDIARTCHAHPTLNESLKEAALDVLRMAIHK
jgi:dihydrolipoamide dehydrogenase